jgi:hypothetical protein
VDKFEHEKHNRRERVYKFPRINLWTESVANLAKLNKQRERDALELRCLSLYRDFFRNPRHHEYVGETILSKRFSDLPLNLNDDLKTGAKIFRLIEYGSERYKEFMTPREILFWDESNRVVFEKYRAAIESLKEVNRIQKNQDMLNALRRNGFERD